MNIEEQMSISALRYALGRQTYIVDDTIKWIKDKTWHSQHFLGVALKDISEQLDTYPETPYKEDWQGLHDHLSKLLTSSNPT